MHSHTAPGTIRAFSVDKVGLFSWRLWAVRKAKFAKIGKFERKKTGARIGARHVRWESCQLAAHTRVGLINSLA